MADITGLAKEIINTAQDGVTKHVVWATLTTTNRTGDVWVNPNYRNVCVQVKGTFGASAAITMQGTNDESSEVWFTLTDGNGIAAGNDVKLSAAGGRQIYETPYKIRPSLSDGDGSTDIDVTLVAHSTVRK